MSDLFSLNPCNEQATYLSQKLNVLGHSVLLAHASNLLPGVVLGLADKVEHARSRTRNVTLVSLLEVGVELIRTCKLRSLR